MPKFNSEEMFKAMQFANMCYGNQTDNNGIPLICKVAEIANSCDNVEQAICSYLQYVETNSMFTIDNLEADGFSTDTVRKLKKMRYNKRMNPMEYIESLGDDVDCLVVTLKTKQWESKVFGYKEYRDGRSQSLDIAKDRCISEINKIISIILRNSSTSGGNEHGILYKRALQLV